MKRILAGIGLALGLAAGSAFAITGNDLHAVCTAGNNDPSLAAAVDELCTCIVDSTGENAAVGQEIADLAAISDQVAREEALDGASQDTQTIVFACLPEEA